MHSSPRTPLLLTVALAALTTGCADGAGTGAATGERAAARTARVTGVADGDTISLSGLGRVRLIGIDTPEVSGGAECFGREAAAFTRRLLPRGRRVRYRVGAEPRDRYGRALAYVWLDDGRMVNRVLVERGYAQPLTIPPNVDYADDFVALARRARRARRGLWGARGCATGEGDTRGGRRRCSDFATRRDAQRWWEASGRPAGMDGDGDGRVCETLP